MGQNAQDSDDLKERIFQKILSDSSVTGEQWIQLFAQLKESPETVVERLKGDTVRRAPWLHLFPWAAFFTLLGGVVTAVVTGGFDLLKEQNEQDVGLQIKQMERQAAIFQHLLIIDPDTIAGGADGKNLPELAMRERKARICLAANFGLLEIPDYVLGVGKANPEKYASLLRERLNKAYGCDDADLPVAFPTPAGEAASGVACPTSAELESRSIKTPVPAALESTPAGIMLAAGIGEYNRGVHETCNGAPIQEYMQAVSLLATGTGLPWSAVFTSWLISKSGNAKQIIPSSSHKALWTSALKVGAGFAVGPQNPVRIGDIVVIWRRNMGSALSTATGSSAIDMNGLWVGQSGIVFAIENGVASFIGGDILDAVQVSTIAVADPKIVGVIRP
jgi:hypothetical protein